LWQQRTEAAMIDTTVSVIVAFVLFCRNFQFPALMPLGKKKEWKEDTTTLWNQKTE
jgi:hypothetical protein